MEKYLITAILLAGAVAFAAVSVGFYFCREKNLERFESFLRNRIAGGVLGAAALAWCVPQIQVVAWDFLAQWAWVLAAAALVLCVKYLDNVVARSVGGLLIMGAYSFLDMSFDCKLDLGLSGAFPAWVWGSIGIVIAAKPCYLRDYLRLSAKRSLWRYTAVGLCGISALFLLTATLLFWKVQG